MERVDLSRRHWLERVSHGIFALLAVGGTWLGLRFLLPPKLRDLAQLVSAGPLAELPAGASTYLPDHDVYVLHWPEGLAAISGRCSHLGCSVQRQVEGFSCPCHGARFGAQGQVLSGPAPRALTWYKVSVDRRGIILVHLEEELPIGSWSAV